MRVVSLVPSWTETLLACGVNVVGRTRFCIHPETEVKRIPIIGGTKNLKKDLFENLKPELLILDREENPKQFADEAECETFITHIQGVEDVGQELKKLSHLFIQTGDTQIADNLLSLSERWKAVCLKRFSDKKNKHRNPAVEDLPGILEWINPASPNEKEVASRYLVYVIWQNPWMAVAPGTFIASVLETLGWPKERIWPGRVAQSQEEKYPKFELSDLPEDSVLFFSTEPYPFTRNKHELARLPFASALVDGESYSWFGLRTLEFLEQNL